MSNMGDTFPAISITELADSLAQMKQDITSSMKDRSEEFYEEGQFLLAIIFNLENEIVGVTELEGLELNKKVRIIAFLNLFYECLNASMGDEDEDEDDFDDEDDEDEDDDDDLGDDEDEDEDTQSKSSNKVSSKIEQLSHDKKKPLNNK